MNAPNYSISVENIGDYNLDQTIEFDFAMNMPGKVQSISTSCGCASANYSKAGQVKIGEEEYPVYRFTGRIHVGIPKHFKNLETAPESKTYKKTISVFFEGGDISKVKTIQMEYTIYKEPLKKEDEKEITIT